VDTAAAQATRVPQDTDDTRRQHFARLVKHPLTLSLGSTAAIAAFVFATMFVNPAVGAAAAVGVILLTLLIVFLIASGRATEDFFRAYADGRALSREKKGHLPGATPLLRKGDERHGTQIMRGALPSGIEGTVSRYTYEEHSTDSRGRRHTSYYNFTVVLTEIPESALQLGELYCQRRVGFRFLDGAEDIFRTRERVTLESETLDERFEIFAGRDQDPNWLRQLFSPTFVAWLGESAPEDFAFEVVAGLLCVNVTGHLDSAAELDSLCGAASVVAGRLHEESTETAA
jgi:hypothetical protein